MLEEIINVLDSINYRFIDDETLIYTPEEVIAKKEGNCWEQVELTRKLFLDQGISVDTYFVSLIDENYKFQTHTFVVYQNNSTFYWVEHAWEMYKGVHEYDDLKTLLSDVKCKLIEDFKGKGEVFAFVYKYDKPLKPMKAPEFLNYVQRQKLIKLNDPLYFYHVVDKNADMSVGLLSLKYFYDNKMYDLFDKYAEKYKMRIVGPWNIKRYKGRVADSLKREEVLDALSEFRGKYGPSYIYFFRFPLYKELGKRIENLLKVKDIYRININDEEVQLHINDIFYGYEDSNSDNLLLQKGYYESVTEEEYFSKYNDDEEMNFSKLNHISIAFDNDFCPIKFLEKC